MPGLSRNLPQVFLFKDYSRSEVLRPQGQKGQAMLPELSQDSNLGLLMSKSTQSDYQRIVMMMTVRRKKNIIYFLNPKTITLFLLIISSTSLIKTVMAPGVTS